MNKPVNKVCSECGSENVTHDALVRWCKTTQQWEISGVLDNSDCGECAGECSIEDEPLEGPMGMEDHELQAAISATDGGLSVEDKFGDGDQYWVYYIGTLTMRDRSDEGYDTWREAAIEGLIAWNKQNEPEREILRLSGADGDIDVDANTGETLATTSREYRQILCFDLIEARRWEQRAGLPPGISIDILCYGYWHKDALDQCSYEPAEDDYRFEVELAQKKREEA
jgi:hypothetical protein